MTNNFGEFSISVPSSMATYKKIYKPFHDKFFIWKKRDLQWFVENILFFEKTLFSFSENIAKIKKIVSDESQSTITITQDKINGENLDFALRNDLTNSIYLCEKIFVLAKDLIQNSEARIDFNLSNFIVHENNTLYYVDFTPPLLISAVKPPTNLLQECYFSLCFNIETQVYELMCNIFRHHLIKNDREKTLHFANRFLDTALSYFDIGDLRNDVGFVNKELNGQNRPIQRFNTIFQYLHGYIDYDTMTSKYSQYSLKKI